MIDLAHHSDNIKLVFFSDKVRWICCCSTEHIQSQVIYVADLIRIL